MTSNVAQYTIDMIVRDVPGTLLRVAQVFARRGCNIDSVNVTHQKDTPWSQMLITVHNVGSIDQIMRQLEKLVDVHSVTVQTAWKKE